VKFKKINTLEKFHQKKIRLIWGKFWHIFISYCDISKPDNIMLLATKQTNPVNPGERKYLYTLFLAALVFSLWFYLGLTTKERFALAHGYGGVSEAKELIGILGIAFAFIISLIHYQSNKKATGFLLLTVGLGLILSRSILHSTHMVNAMEPNSLLIEAIFEGENHLLLSISDALGAVFIALGVTSFLSDRRGSYLLITVAGVTEVALLIMILGILCFF
jgi:hypothetical protein